MTMTVQRKRRCVCVRLYVPVPASGLEWPFIITVNSLSCPVSRSAVSPVQSRPGDCVCPSVCQFSYFQNLISARSHSHPVDYILISITSTQRWSCKSHHFIFDWLVFTPLLNERVRHKHWAPLERFYSHQPVIWLLFDTFITFIHKLYAASPTNYHEIVSLSCCRIEQFILKIF